MKRVIRWSLILGLICCLLGVGMMTAGVMMGGADFVSSNLHKIPEHIEEHDWDDVFEDGHFDWEHYSV
ncbi:MAG: hypothetical protein PHV18_00600 [Lachnospiraceae bacterium]|nr:hypothetical protein [Lachnospiraceae bacterium]